MKLLIHFFSPDCERWFDFEEAINGSGQVYVQPTGREIEDTSEMPNQSDNDKEIELYRQIYTTDWQNPVWDSIPAYNVPRNLLQKYLMNEFGNYDFLIAVSIDKRIKSLVAFPPFEY